jgi:hypothetical protein
MVILVLSTKAIIIVTDWWRKLCIWSIVQSWLLDYSWILDAFIRIIQVLMNIRWNLRILEWCSVVFVASCSLCKELLLLLSQLLLVGNCRRLNQNLTSTLRRVLSLFTLAWKDLWSNWSCLMNCLLIRGLHTFSRMCSYV